jgi:Glucose / Sorbosone dehydrogenase
MTWVRHRVVMVLVFLLTISIAPYSRWQPAPALAATVPPGFLDSTFVSGLVNPTAMEFAPDGRLFVAEQNGTLRVIKNGTLLPTPFLSVATDATGERGLLGVAFDPNLHRITSSASITPQLCQPCTTGSADSRRRATSQSPAARSCWPNWRP